MKEINDITSQIIAAAIEVHRRIGPGLLESSYSMCLEKEFILRKVPYQKQVSIPLNYKGLDLGCVYRLDFIVEDQVVVELKAVDVLLPVHSSQLLSYLKLGKWHVGLLINFHVPLLRDGIKRLVLELFE
jgi:GxxExxY protein